MKFWHINGHSPDNAYYMIRNKRAHIGLGNNNDDYEKRKLNKHSTVYQFERCKNNIKKGDIIILYQNKIGYTHLGVYTGYIYQNTISDKLPDWSETEITYGFKVKQWLRFNNIIKEKYPLRGTLVNIKQNNKIIDYIAQDKLIYELFKDL